jgi:hypothetical protein
MSLLGSQRYLRPTSTTCITCAPLHAAVGKPGVQRRGPFLQALAGSKRKVSVNSADNSSSDGQQRDVASGSAAGAGHGAAADSQASSAAGSSQQQQQQPQQQPLVQQPSKPRKTGTRQLDVARAVQLLKLTSTRTKQKPLPPWFTRTQDPDMWGEPAQQQQQGPATRNSADADLSTLDSYMALGEDEQQQWQQWQQEQQPQRSSSLALSDSQTSSYNSTAGAGDTASPVQGSTAGSDAAVPGTSSSSSGGTAGGSSSSSYSRRMFSASDPIRGGSEWRLPWQVRLPGFLASC